MVFDRYLEPDDRERIEGYLAHKWGITEDLAGTTFKIKEGLSLYFPFEETDGGTVYDSSKAKRNATLQDIPGTDLSVADKFGSGLKLGNMPASRIEMGMNAVDLPNNWTISVWLETPLVENGLVDYWHTLATEAGGDQRHVVFDQAEIRNWVSTIRESSISGAPGMANTMTAVGVTLRRSVWVRIQSFTLMVRR